MNSDRDLIRSFYEGNEFAFVAIYNRYKQGIYAFSLRMLRNENEAEDVLQDTFLKAYECKSKLIELESLRAWLFTVARNKCLNKIRQRKIRQHETFDESVQSSGRSIHKELEKHELVELVGKAISSLSPDYREVIILREYQNLSYDEICQVTRSSLNAVKSRLFKARRKLSLILEESPVNSDVFKQISD